MGKDEGLTGGEAASEGRLSALRRAGRASMSRRASEVSGAVKNFDAKSAVDAMLEALEPSSRMATHRRDWGHHSIPAADRPRLLGHDPVLRFAFGFP